MSDTYLELANSALGKKLFLPWGCQSLSLVLRTASSRIIVVARC